MNETLDGFPTLTGSDLQQNLVDIRRHLHRFPEVGFEEFETASFIEMQIIALGLKPIRVADTGVYVDIQGSRPGPLVGYRADIDALPIQDAKTDVPYRSTRPGVAHLCGHDVHTTVALGIVRTLLEQHDRICGTIRVFFQPNEEGTPSGAPRIIAAGVIDGMDAVYGIHVDPTLNSGMFGLIRGPVTASADKLDLIVRGATTGHSARPHTVTDTVYVATTLAQHLYTLSGRITDSRYPSILTLCKFQAGDAYNVIPKEVSFGGTLRCVDEHTRRFLHDHIRKAAEHFGALYGCEIEAKIQMGAPPLLNDGALIDRVEKVIHHVHSEDAVYTFPLPSMGGEDFAYYTARIPGAFIRVGTRDSERTGYPVHDSLFDIDESVLLPTTYMMSEILLHHANH